MPAFDDTDSAALIRIKAVPGARSDQIAGLLGDRLKVRIAAPPEDGKANKAICKLIAKQLGVPARALTIEIGHTSPEKVIRAEGVTAEQARVALVGT